MTETLPRQLSKDFAQLNFRGGEYRARLHPHLIELVQLTPNMTKLAAEFSAYLPSGYQAKEYGVKFFTEEEGVCSLNPIGLVMRSGKSFLDAVLFLVKKYNIPVTYLELTPLELLEARSWIKDCCPWQDLRADQVDELADSEVIAGIERHYDGGIKGFKLATEQ